MNEYKECALEKETINVDGREELQGRIFIVNDEGWMSVAKWNRAWLETQSPLVAI